jgi:hypothetical protein
MLSNQRSIYKRFRYTQIGLQTWISADAISTITANASNLVSQWKDRTINSRHFVQSTDANKPTFIASAINSLPAIRFNGTTSFLNFSDTTLSWLNNSSFTIFYVASKTAGASNQYVIGGTATGTRNNLSAGYVSTNTYRFGMEGDNLSTVVPVVTSGRPELYAMTYSIADNSRVIRRNGTVVGLGASGGSLNSMTAQTLGRYLSTFGQFDLGELLIYNRVLSAYEITQVERDLLSKWSIT